VTPVSMPLKCAGCTADAVWTVVGDVAKAEQMTAAVVSSPTPSRTPLSICGKKSRQSSRTGMLATLAGGAGACSGGGGEFLRTLLKISIECYCRRRQRRTTGRWTRWCAALEWRTRAPSKTRPRRPSSSTCGAPLSRSLSTWSCLVS
jgi:hypothetical protein